MENKILFVGMYDSGKTTFIACLWDYINSSKPGKTLALSTLANTENEYLDKIRSEWLKCLKVTRTYMENKTENVVMKATHVASGQNLSIEIPDISGELFNSHFQVREWSQDFEKLISGLGGIVLFINPMDEKNRTQYITDAAAIENDIVSEISEQVSESTVKKVSTQAKTADTIQEPKPNDEKKIEFTAWSEEHTSNQVKLVENLQFMEYRNVFKDKIKVSVVVSCWDLLEKAGKKKPEVWVEKHLPLLHQYLTSNGILFECKYFGVSAQGCDYKDTEEVKKLKLVETYERAKVKEGEEFTNDISGPIIWLTADGTKN